MALYTVSHNDVIFLIYILNVDFWLFLQFLIFWFLIFFTLSFEFKWRRGVGHLPTLQTTSLFFTAKFWQVCVFFLGNILKLE